MLGGLTARTPFAYGGWRNADHRSKLNLTDPPCSKHLPQPFILKGLYSATTHREVPSFSRSLPTFALSFGRAMSFCKDAGISYRWMNLSRDSLNSHCRICRSGTAICIVIGASG